MNQSSVKFANGGEYLFGMDVFHQLHCLDYLRKKTILYHPLYPDVEEDEDIPVAYHIGKHSPKLVGGKRHVMISVHDFMQLYALQYLD